MREGGEPGPGAGPVAVDRLDQGDACHLQQVVGLDAAAAVAHREAVGEGQHLHHDQLDELGAAGGVGLVGQLCGEGVDLVVEVAQVCRVVVVGRVERRGGCHGTRPCWRGFGTAVGPMCPEEDDWLDQPGEPEPLTRVSRTGV